MPDLMEIESNPKHVLSSNTSFQLIKMMKSPIFVVKFRIFLLDISCYMRVSINGYSPKCLVFVRENLSINR